MYVRKQTGLRAKARLHVVYHYHRFAAADAKKRNAAGTASGKSMMRALQSTDSGALNIGCTRKNSQDCADRWISRRFYQFFHLFPIYPHLSKVLAFCPAQVIETGM
ncbi:hypothetical protein [Paenibacillus sp. JJ-223]|uniref:hypothetical protein n=1 Tax=Paenibacillus sp. JJ-223 TaxID=2905647 RepID=UPI001F38F19D|nr:hypothetical protein [Paenibacillus sp. JJ-223]CAH1195679.1 hypothetical protein PAECIP111890_00796 [Paenibacillus sp. JJ-223]